MGKKTGPKHKSSPQSILAKVDKLSPTGRSRKEISSKEKAALIKLNKDFLEFRKEYRNDTMEKIEADMEITKGEQLKRLAALKSNLFDQLTSQQHEFVKHYLMDHDVKRAGMMAGLSKGYAESSLLNMPTIRDYIKVVTRMHELTTGITKEFVIAEFLKLAKVSVQELYDKNGNMIPPHKLRPDVAAAVSEIKEKSWMEKQGEESIPVKEITYKLHSKLVALDSLAKHVGLYEKDNNQKRPVVVPQFILPHNGRNKDLLENNNITPHEEIKP